MERQELESALALLRQQQASNPQLLVAQALGLLDPEAKAYTMRIERDDDPQSPDDWDNEDLFLVAFHRSFEVTRKGFTSAEDVGEWRDEYAILPLYAYIHGGVSLSVSGFSCPWDSGQVGYVLVRKGAGFSMEDGTAADTPEVQEYVAKLLVEEWNQYLGGDVWGYIIEDSEGDDIDSCWGIYGEENAYSEGEEALKHLNEKRGFGPAKETA